MDTLIPQKSLILCEKVETQKQQGNIVIPDDASKSTFSVYMVVSPGTDVQEFYEKGDVIIVDDEHLNHVFYGGKMRYFIDDGYVVAKIVKNAKKRQKNGSGKKGEAVV